MRPFDPETLRALADDLERLAHGRGPDPRLLARAPLLEGWAVVKSASPVLAGIVTGHPTCGPGPIVTSTLWRIDAEAGWARTTNRLYRLGG